MARARLTDYIGVSKFHLLDVGWSSGIVLLPVFGFKSVTLPEWSVEYREIKPGNEEFRKIGAVEKASVSNVVLEQGVSLLNSDFYKWIKDATFGKKEARDLLLIQFANVSAKSDALNAVGSAISGAASFIPGASGGGLSFEDGFRLPARGWYLKRCKPVRYRPGTDFDALNSEISIASLEIAVETFEEFSLGS
jgi:phage tail-like protein